MRSSLPPSLLEAGELLVSSSSPPPSADDAAQFLRGYSAVSTGYELEAEAGLQPVGTHLVGWRDRTPLRPPAERDVETSDSARHGDLYHRCARIGCFVALCLASYVVTRVIAMLNLPTDGRRTWQGGDFAADVGRLCECAVVLAWLTGVDTAGRTRWLVADPSRAFGLILLFVAVSPAFSALNSVPGWDKGLASIAAWAPGALAVLSASSGVGLLMILWLVLYAYRHLSRSAFVAYVATRLCIIAYYGLAYGAALGAYDAGEELRSPTMHHLYIAFVVASFGSFNTLISDLVLAVGAGIFVQGVGSYGFSPLVAPAGCRTVNLPQPVAASVALASGCTFSSAVLGGESVQLHVCPARLSALRESQFMRCASSHA